MGGKYMVAVHNSRNSKDGQAENTFLHLTKLNSIDAQTIESRMLDLENTIALCDS